MAPKSATKDLFASEQSKQEKWSTWGGKASGVPGSPMGLFTVLKNYGTMSFAEVAAPALALAEDGFTVDPLLASMIRDNFDKITAFNPEGTTYTPEGLPLEQGTLLRQPVLAKTFRLLAEKGPDVYYKGEIGEAVVRAVNKAGGNMTMEDLANYKIEKREPMKGTYRGFSIMAPPPASSAGTHVIQILNVLENFPVKEWGHNSELYLHHLSEISKMMFADRAKYMADTAFADVPLAGLISKEYAKQLAAKIAETSDVEITAGDPAAFMAAPKFSRRYGPAGDHSEHMSTTHFSVVDNKGNMVA
jgi:gamma-glutamyltranspeptidase/glutathione hydrolase